MEKVEDDLAEELVQKCPVKFFDIEYFGGVGLLVNEIHLSHFL